MDETLKPIEENGFLLMDFTPEITTLRYFKWNQKSQPISDIENGAWTPSLYVHGRHKTFLVWNGFGIDLKQQNPR
jgi:hypothetical protein